jgi:hypothetical protein
MPTITDHDTTARRIALAVARGTTPAAAADQSARQGDLVLQRTADAPSADPEYAPTPPCGVTLAVGNHGEHRLIAPVALIRWTDGVATAALPQGGLVVHTDQPAGRHGAIRLAPGIWEARRQRELDLTTALVSAVVD